MTSATRRSMGNYVTAGVGNYVTRNPPHLGNFVIAHTAFTDPDHLMRRLRHGLRQIQYRSHLIDGCLTGTGLTPTTPQLQSQ
ncbi:hypothetical protein OV450_8014 [Actinobacteria bacterium OV450]|nr:hypothetical protein OV450_8014 [Actinobacteria bacterium OV450]